MDNPSKDQLTKSEMWDMICDLKQELKDSKRCEEYNRLRNRELRTQLATMEREQPVKVRAGDFKLTEAMNQKVPLNLAPKWPPYNDPNTF